MQNTVYVLFERNYCEPSFFRGVYPSEKEAEVAKAFLAEQDMENFARVTDYVIKPWRMGTILG